MTKPCPICSGEVPKSPTEMCDAHQRRWYRGARGEKLTRPIRPLQSKEDFQQAIEEIRDELQVLAPVYDTEWKRFCAWVGIERERKAKVPVVKESNRHRYMVISDLHVPFHNERAVLEAIDAGVKAKIQTLIIGGDFLDCYSLSRFIQYERVPIKDEFIAARKLLDICSREFPIVKVLTGNHEERERKHFATKLTLDEREWLLSKCILERVSEDMPNVEIVKRRVFDTEMFWLVQIGKDAIIGHPETSSKVPLKPVDAFRLWLDQWHEAIGLDRPRLVIMGHTHQAGMAWSGNTYIVENGCLCRIQGYALSPRLYSKPQRLAYTMFDQVDGYTDMNSVRQFYPFANERRAA